MLKNLLCQLFTNFRNKLERLSLASLSTSIMFVGKAGAYQCEESALASPTKVRLSWEAMPGANTLAYCKN